MKPIYATFLISSVCLLTGCTSNIGQTVKCNTNIIGTSVAKGVGDFTKQITKGRKENICNSKNNSSIFFADLVPQTAYQGHEVFATICYPISVRENVFVDVVETRELKFPDGELLVMSEETLKRDKGYWDSSFTFEVPEDADPGAYEVTQRITYGDIEYTKTHSLEIREKYKECY